MTTTTNDMQCERPPLKAGALAILETAERLFAHHGIEGVSVRQITLASGMANNSAVSYHFGNKAGLLEAIYRWRLPLLEQAGRALQDEAERQGRLQDPETLVGILLRPYCAITDAEGRHIHAAFMNQVIRSAEGLAIHMSLHTMFTYGPYALERLAAVLSHVPLKLLRYRLKVGTMAFFDALMEQDMGRSDPDYPTFTNDALLGELIGMVTAICTRPAVAAPAA